MKISVSILSSDNKEESVKKLNNTDIDYLHIDVMDNIFVSNKAFSLEEINNISLLSNKKLDVHLMVNDPISYIKYLNKDNIEFITFHIELDSDINNIIDSIRKINKKVGLAISPDTDINKLFPYLDKIDMILIMSVIPGKGGQKFILNTLNRIKKLKEKINNNVLIEVDGGINDETIKLLKNVDISVVGSFITNYDNYQEQINKLK